MADPKSHLVERVAERLLQSGALEESAAHLLGPGRATPADPAPVARIGRGAEPATYASPASELAIRPEPGSGAGIVLLDRLPVPDEAAASLAVPGILRGPEPSEGLRSIDAAALERAGMVDWSRTRSRVSEEFRLVQRQILRNAFAPPGAERGFTNLLMVDQRATGRGQELHRGQPRRQHRPPGQQPRAAGGRELQAQFHLLSDGTRRTRQACSTSQPTRRSIPGR